MTPPQTATAAPTSEAQAPAATAPLEAGSDGNRMPQRMPLKTAAVEETQATFLRRQAEAAQMTKAQRDSRIAAGRDGDGPGDLSGA